VLWSEPASDTHRLFDEAVRIKQAPDPMRTTTLLACAVLSLPVLVSAQPAELVTRALSLNECIGLALEHNLDVRIQRYDPAVAELTLKSIYGAYDPEFVFQASTGLSTRESTFDPGTGLQSISSQSPFSSGGSTFRGQLPSGMSYDVNASARRTSERSRPGEQYDGSVELNARQPLLKNFWIDGTRQQIQINQREVIISELAFRSQLMRTVTDVQLAYYELIFAIGSVKVQEKALQLAERLLAENKKRVEVGALAPLDEKQAESQVASSRADMIFAQRELAVRQNTLKRLITDDYLAWHSVEIVPAESLVAVAEAVDRIESWRHGLQTRPDLLSLREEVEKQNIVLRYQQNQLFPALDLVGSFGYNGLDSSTNAVLANFDGVLDDIYQQRNPTYSVGAILSFPLGNRTARNRFRASQTSKERLLLQLKKLEQDILIEIDDALKLTQSNFERVDATRQARLYAEAALDAEQKKLENGKSTSFVVLQLQRDLTAALSSEIRALADYNRSLALLALSEASTLERRKINVSWK
jgi:outer membrane protein TolC